MPLPSRENASGVSDEAAYGNPRFVKEVLRSNDVVLLSFVDALLKDAGIEHAVLDGNMSITEGSIGIFPRRVCVAEDEWMQARRILTDAGLEENVCKE